PFDRCTLCVLVLPPCFASANTGAAATASTSAATAIDARLLRFMAVPFVVVPPGTPPSTALRPAARTAICKPVLRRTGQHEPCPRRRDVLACRAVVHVVVDEAHRLHERIRGRRPDERPAAAL